MSFNSFPCAPAFIITAPPIVPGIPESSSNPVISSFNNFCANNPTGTPASTFIICLLFSFFISMSFKFNFAVIPLIPLSVTSRLLPFPIIVSGI